MSEVLRSQPNTSEERRNQRRNQLTFNMAELAVLTLVNPTEILHQIGAKATTLALEPEITVSELEDEALLPRVA